jgi:hypothetical protein
MGRRWHALLLAKLLAPIAVAAQPPTAIDVVPIARLSPADQIALFDEASAGRDVFGAETSLSERIGLRGWLRLQAEADDALTSTAGLDARVLLLREGRFTPAVVIGTEALGGQQSDARDFVALSRRYYRSDLTVGWSRGLYEGPFAALAIDVAGNDAVWAGLGLHSTADAGPKLAFSVRSRLSDALNAALLWSPTRGGRLALTYTFDRYPAPAPRAEKNGLQKAPAPPRLSTDYRMTMSPADGVVWAQLDLRPMSGQRLAQLAYRADAAFDAAPSTITIVPERFGLQGPALQLDRAVLRALTDHRGSAEEIVADLHTIPPPPLPRPPQPLNAGLVLRSDLDTPPSGAAIGANLATTLELDGPISGAWHWLVGVDLLRLTSESRIASDTPIRSDQVALADSRYLELRELAVGHHDGSGAWMSAAQMGWLDPQFAGVDWQGLYSLPPSRWAMGGEASLVVRRDPAAALAVMRGRVFGSALATANYAWPDQAADLTLRAGRFLGGDWGGEATVAHRWPRGVIGQVGLAVSSGRTDDPAGAMVRLALTLPIGVQADSPLQSRAELRAGGVFDDRAQRLQRRVDLVSVHHATAANAALGDWVQFLKEVYFPEAANP